MNYTSAYTAPQELSIFSNNNIPTPIPDGNKARIILEKYKAKTPPAKEVLRYDDLDEVEINDTDDYKVDWEGVRYIKCWIPFDKSTKSIDNILLSYTNNLVFLNPTLKYASALNIMKKINDMFDYPCSEMKVHGIVNSIFEYKDKGSLKPNFCKKLRNIIFKKGAVISREEKLKICVEENAKRKTAISMDKMKEIIGTWDFDAYGKISGAKIIENNSISKKTVEKYYPRFKQQIQILNNNYKNNIKQQITK